MSLRTPSIRLDIAVSATRRFDGLNQREIARLTRRACAELGVTGGEVSIRLADDAEMAELHEQHTGVSGPTDVLTFHYGGGGSSEPIPPDGRLEVEIVVGAMVAQREARQRGHGAGAELMLYVIHGLLHCLGYDDHDAASAASMHKREDAVLSAIGIGPAFRAPPAPRRG